MANIGVHGRLATLHLKTLWIRNITITSRAGRHGDHADPVAVLAGGQLDVSSFLTHRFGKSDIEQTYQVFATPRTPGRSRC